jgi:hypothetical protein
MHTPQNKALLVLTKKDDSAGLTADIFSERD